MNPDFQLQLVVLFAISLLVVAIIFYFSSRERRHASRRNRTMAQNAVIGLIAEMSSTSRHRWVETPEGEMIQFIYLLLGRFKTCSDTGHLVWAEVTLRRNVSTVNLFHTGGIAPDDEFLAGTVKALRARGLVVSVVKTDAQPNLEHTGVH